MSNMKQYGHYWIAASIAVTGVLWLFRPGDARVMGEDYAALFETCQNALLIPYLTGSQIPDWNDANQRGTYYPSNSIYSVIRYNDILKMADRSRYIVGKPDGSIFWTEQDIDADTVEVAVSHGGYATTNSAGVLVNFLNGGGYRVTNSTYAFSTNTFSDSFVTTATRMWQTNSQFETVNRRIEVNTPVGNYETWGKTNLPLANLVFGRGAATGLTNSSGFQTPGSWWPFSRSYAYPWEQWNTGDRSRVSVLRKSYDNVAWTNVFVSTNSLSFSVVAQQTGTNSPAFAGYSVSTFMALDGTESVTFAYVRPPDAANGIYINRYAFYMLGYATNDVRAVPSSQGYFVNIEKQGAARNKYLSFSTVYGTPMLRTQNGSGQESEQWSIFWPDTTISNALSIVKFSIDAAGVSPIYIALSLSYPGLSKSNDAFVVTSNWAEMGAVAGTINAGKIPTFKEMDDERITTNKLNQLAEVLTNLYRTVYIGPHDLITATNQQVVIQNEFVITNYPAQWIDNQPGETPTYYTGYDRNTQIDELLVVSTVTTNNFTVNTELLESGQFQYWLAGEAIIYTNFIPALEWDSVVSGFGSFERRKNNQLGCSLTYPSLWAITNGYVKRVQVYAAVECIQNLDQPYIEDQIVDWDMYSHNAGGEYWNQGNYGITWSNGVINAPSVALPSGRTTGVHRVYSSKNNFGCTDRAIFTRIYDVSNPTSAISFDLPAIQASLPNFKERYAYLDWKTAASGERREGWYYNHSVGWQIRISRVMIVVDWELDGMLKE